MKYLVVVKIVILLITIQISALSQNDIIQGKIMYNSSGKVPAVGVRIEAWEVDDSVQLSNSVYSSSSGEFILKLVNKSSGDLIKIKLGNQDQTGKLIEVVNSMELESFHIPSNKNNVFEIIVSKKGERDLIAQRYYKILKTTADVELNKAKNKINLLINQKGQDDKTIRQLINQRDSVQTAYENALVHLEERAYFIASVNLDEANEIVKEAILMLDQQRDIEKALEILNFKKLEKIHEENQKGINELVDKIEIFKNGERKIVEAYEIRISLLSSKFLYKEQIACYNKIIEIHKKNDFGEDELADYLSYASSAYYDDGQMSKALEYRKNAITIQELRGEKLNPKLAINYYQTGNIYYALSKYEDALSFFEKAISIQEKSLDKADIHLATSYIDIARTYDVYKSNDSLTLSYILKATKIQEVFPDTMDLKLASNYSAIGEFYNHFGEYTKAIKFLQKAISVQEEKLDPLHPILSFSYENIALAYKNIGDFSKSINYFQKSISIYKATSDTLSSNFGTLYTNYSLVFINMGEYTKALDLLEKAISIHKLTLSPNSRQLAAGYNTIAVTYFYLGEYKNGIKYMQKCLDIQKIILDPYSSELASTYNNIAAFYRLLGDFKNALEYQLKDVTIAEKVLNEFSPELAISYTGLGDIYLNLGDISKALEYQTKATNIVEEIFDPQNPALSTYYFNLAHTYRALKNYSKSIKFHEKDIAVSEINLDSKHPELAKSYVSFGITYFESGQFTKSFDYLMKGITIQEEILDSNNSFLAISHCELGRTYLALNDTINALAYLEKGMSILGETDIYNPNIVKYIQEIGVIYANKKQFVKAEEVFLKYQEKSKNSMLNKRNWAMFYALKKDKNKAISFLEEAVELGYDDLSWIQTNPNLEYIRSHRCYKKIIKKLKKLKKNKPN